MVLFEVYYYITIDILLYQATIDILRAAERLAGARGNFFFQGPLFKTTSPPPSTTFQVKKFSGRVRCCNCFPGTFSQFSMPNFGIQPKKTRYLVLCAEIFNTQKRLGSNKKFSGAPSTSGPDYYITIDILLYYYRHKIHSRNFHQQNPSSLNESCLFQKTYCHCTSTVAGF